MRPMSILCLLLVIASPASVTALTYQGTTQIKGTVLDPNEAVIYGAQITFRDKGRTTRAHSNERGVFEIDLPPGIHEVEIAVPGFKRLVVTNLEVIIGMTEELKFHLEPQLPTFCPPITGGQDERIEKVHSPLSERIKPRKIQ